MLNSALLGEICNVTTGQSAPQDSRAFSEDGIPFIRAGSLEGLLAGKRENQLELINDSNAKKYGLKLFQKNTVIFAKSGMSAKIGRVYRLKTPCYLVSHLAAVSVSEKIDPGYLQRWFERNPPSRLIDNEAYPSIKTSVIQNIKIPLPPIEEQKRIAAVLDAADALRAKRREAIAQLDALLQSTFLDMFGDPVTNPKGWDDTHKLGELTDIVSGVTKGRRINGQKTREIAYLAVVNVQDRYLSLKSVKTIEATLDEIAKYSLRFNDILLTEGGDPDKLGRGSLWHEELRECIHQNHIFRVRVSNPEKLHPVFLNWLIGSIRGKTYFLRSAKQTTGIASINMTQLRAFPVLIPPFDLQRRFASIVEAAERQKAKMRAHLDELNTLFASLQSRAFKGEL